MDILNNDIQLVVEDGYNTSYIDALLTALFYKETSATNFILDNIPKKSEGYYLQELIKTKYVNPLRKNCSITSNIINEIRNYSIICGWSKNTNITELKDLCEFYIFLADIFNIPKIECEIIDIKDNILITDTNKIAKDILIFDLKDNDTIRNLMIKWIDNNIKNINNCYKLCNIPQFITIKINRFNPNGLKNNYKIDIMKRIKFFGNNDTSQNYIKWKLHSFVCYDGKINTDGNYYTVIMNHDKKWLKFKNNQIPSFKEINLLDTEIQNKFMSEVYLLIYVLEI
jgi:hypothetical protein